MEQDKWIEEAFKNAVPDIKGFSEKMSGMFMKDFPFTMKAFEFAYGKEAGLKASLAMLRDTDLVILCQCFFSSGYVARMHEDGDKTI